jgi:hypothetical protein
LLRASEAAIEQLLLALHQRIHIAHHAEGVARIFVQPLGEGVGAQVLEQVL